MRGSIVVAQRKQHYPIDPGTIYGGEYPGDRNSEIARARILGLVDLGIRTFIDLTSPHDYMEPYEGLLAELGKGNRDATAAHCRVDPRHGRS